MSFEEKIEYEKRICDAVAAYRKANNGLIKKMDWARKELPCLEGLSNGEIKGTITRAKILMEVVSGDLELIPQIADILDLYDANKIRQTRTEWMREHVPELEDKTNGEILREINKAKKLMKFLATTSYGKQYLDE